MPKVTAYSEHALRAAIGQVWEDFRRTGYMALNWKPEKPRSIPQNAISHEWYGQAALENRERDAVQWKSYCKLHHGVPILRAEDEDFRAAYDAAIKPLTYENKLEAMKFWPVTSLMTTAQLSKYLEAVQDDLWTNHRVRLDFPTNTNSAAGA